MLLLIKQFLQGQLITEIFKCIWLTAQYIYSTTLQVPPYSVLVNPYTYTMGADSRLPSNAASNNNPISRIVLNAGLNNAQKTVIAGGNMSIKFNLTGQNDA